MNSKPDIEYEERGDISLLSEIITNLMYWQEIVRRKSVKLGENLEDIINIAEVKRTQYITKSVDTLQATYSL